MSKGWDNAMIKKLKALTGKGLSTAEIGKRLGLSKNAVVGKLNRLGWNLKASVAAVATSGTKKSSGADKKATKASAAKKVAATTKGAKTVTAAKKVTANVTAAKKASAKKVAVKEKKADAKTVKAKVATEPKVNDKKEDKKSLNKSLAMHQRIVQHALELASLKSNQCRWPIGDPDSENFHFCGETVFVGKPYCYEHCKQAYQFTPPKKK